MKTFAIQGGWLDPQLGQSTPDEWSSCNRIASSFRIKGNECGKEALAQYNLGSAPEAHLWISHGTVSPCKKIEKSDDRECDSNDRLALGNRRGYASDPRAPIDNNVIERDIKNFVIGRKSWLFSDTPQGARASAVIYSLALTCRACGVDPYDWLVHVLTELPRRDPDADIEDLLPYNFVANNAKHPENTS